MTFAKDPNLNAYVDICEPPRKKLKSWLIVIVLLICSLCLKRAHYISTKQDSEMTMNWFPEDKCYCSVYQVLFKNCTQGDLFYGEISSFAINLAYVYSDLQWKFDVIPKPSCWKNDNKGKRYQHHCYEFQNGRLLSSLSRPLGTDDVLCRTNII